MSNPTVTVKTETRTIIRIQLEDDRYLDFEQNNGAVFMHTFDGQRIEVSEDARRGIVETMLVSPPHVVETLTEPEQQEMYDPETSPGELASTEAPLHSRVPDDAFEQLEQLKTKLGLRRDGGPLVRDLSLPMGQMNPTVLAAVAKVKMSTFIVDDIMKDIPSEVPKRKVQQCLNRLSKAGHFKRLERKAKGIYIFETPPWI